MCEMEYRVKSLRAFRACIRGGGESTAYQRPAFRKPRYTIPGESTHVSDHGSCPRTRLPLEGCDSQPPPVRLDRAAEMGGVSCGSFPTPGIDLGDGSVSHGKRQGKLAPVPNGINLPI
jgi:hypothetical protein